MRRASEEARGFADVGGDPLDELDGADESEGVVLLARRETLLKSIIQLSSRGDGLPFSVGIS